MFKSIIIAFSMYSRIPMPIFKWEEKDMEHVIDFIPLVGVVIGAVIYLAVMVGNYKNIPVPVQVLLLMVIPLIITGGFHVDGFMDVQDARNSYLTSEKKLEIMKDPHIGAFAVIRLITLGMVWAAALYCVIQRSVQAGNYRYLWIYGGSFVLVRALCGITSITFKGAKKKGMLSMETEGSDCKDVILLAFFAACAGLFFAIMDIGAGILCVLGIIIFTIYYKKMCDKEFGGVTGDTAGYFVVVGECVITVILGILSIAMK